VIQAVGTAFNVKLAPDGDVEVTVTEGRVELVDPLAAAPAAPAAPRGQRTFDMTLIEGEVAILDAAEGRRDAVPQITRLEPAQVDVKLAWQRGMLIFEGEPLEAMLAEVERYTTADFVVEDEQLRRIRIGGYFRAGDVDGLLISLRENFDIESERIGGDTIVLRAAL
jgi:transmembrane sensor